MLPRARADEPDVELVQSLDQIVAEIEAVVLDVLYSDRIDEVDRRSQCLNSRQIEVAKLKPTCRRGEAQVVRPRNEIQRRFGEADGRYVGRLELGEVSFPIEQAESLRDEQTFVGAGPDEGGAERLGVDWHHANALHHVDDEVEALFGT